MSKQIVTDNRTASGLSNSSHRERSLELEILSLQAQIAKLKADRDKYLEEQEDKVDSDLLARLVPGSGMQRSLPSIRSGQGASRAVFYGPYVRLKAGLYRLSCQITPESTLPSSAPLGISLEVIYRDVVIARESFSRSADGHYHVEFQINYFMSKIFSESLYEFRMSSIGLHAFSVSDIHLSKQSIEKNKANSIEMIDISFPETPKIYRNNLTVFASDGASGHVFYGPYIQLASGKYVFSTKFSTPLGRGVESKVKLDVQSAAGELSSREFNVTDGENELRLEFEVPTCDNYDSLPTRIEFRLEKLAGIAVSVTSIRAIGPMA